MKKKIKNIAWLLVTFGMTSLLMSCYGSGATPPPKPAPNGNPFSPTVQKHRYHNGHIQVWNGHKWVNDD